MSSYAALANKGREEGDCKLANMDVNNAGFKKSSLQMFYEEVNALELNVTLNTECKHNFSSFTRKLHRATVKSLKSPQSTYW